MPMRRILILLFPLLSCGDPSGPAAFAGTYQLLRSNGETLPAPYNFSPTTRIQSGSLLVHNADSLKLTLMIGTSPQDAGLQERWFRYTREGDSLVVLPVSSHHGGRIDGRNVRLFVRLVSPPSTGFSEVPYTFEFRQD